MNIRRLNKTLFDILLTLVVLSLLMFLFLWYTEYRLDTSIKELNQLRKTIL